MSFNNITAEEYQKLINNKNRIFDMTFKTPEILSKYRDDKNIHNEIKQNEKQNKNENYDNIIHVNLDKHFIENENKKKIDEVSRYNYNIIKKKEKELEDKDNESKIKDEELEDKDDKIKDLRNTNIRNRYGNRHKFDNDINILKSFETVFNENDISYNPYKKSKEVQVRYLLNKLKYDSRVDKKLYEYFYDTLKDNKKLSLKIPTKNIIVQNGEGLLNAKKVKITQTYLIKTYCLLGTLQGKN